MKAKLLTVVVTVLSLAAGVHAQNPAEKEILAIHAGLDNAFIKKDIAFFEKTMASDYVYSSPQGAMHDRAKNLEQIKKDWSDTTWKAISTKTENPRVRIMGSTALITADWTFTSQGTAAGAEEHVDKGRYTGVYEKRDGRWMLIAEHFSEAPHDRKLMEQQVMKAGLEYARHIKNRDVDAVANILADEYLFTDNDGKVKTKAEDLADYKSRQVKFDVFETSDQKVRVIGNGAAIETGTVRYKGTSNGKAIEGNERYTTTWVWRGGRWQVAADHISEIK